MLVRIDEVEDLDIVRQLLRAHEYWRLKRLDVDLVILNEQGASYVQDLQDALETLVRTSQSILGHEGHQRHGGVFVAARRPAVRRGPRRLLQAAARAVLAEPPRQPRRAGRSASTATRARSAPPRRRRRRSRPTATSRRPAPRPELEFFNGLGGFADGRPRVRRRSSAPGQSTPAPWINVIANPSFGFQVSESGAGYTWAGNSRENQLTPWSNDPVSDPPARRSTSATRRRGELWGPTALPIRVDESTYVARHGQGYSRFEHAARRHRAGPLQFVPLDDPVKISRPDARQPLGALAAAVGHRLRRMGARHVARRERARGSSPSSIRRPGAIARAQPLEHASSPAGSRSSTWAGGRRAWTADRTEFLGRNGAPDRPAGARPRRTRCSGAIGAGLDPCAALQTTRRARRRGADARSSFCSARPRTASGVARSRPARTGRADLDVELRARRDATGTTSSAPSR